MDFLNISPSLMWFLIGIFLLVLEAATPGFFLMFFGFGALVVSGFNLFLPLGESWQWALFLLFSVSSLLIFRKKVRTLFAGRLSKSDNMDDPVVSEQYIGREVLILKDVTKEEPGLAELNGTNWQARTDGPPLAAGKRARVLRLEGLSLVVAAEDARGLTNEKRFNN